MKREENGTEEGKSEDEQKGEERSERKLGDEEEEDIKEE